MTKTLFKTAFILAFTVLSASFRFTESNAFVKKLHTAYMNQMRIDVGKGFASAMQKNDGACITNNDVAFDEIKKSTSSWKFNPKGPVHAKFAVCVSFIQNDDAKAIMKKIKKGIGSGTSSVVKSPLIIFRTDKTIYTISYSCDLKDTGTEKVLLEEMKKELETEKSNDFIIVKCGGAVTVKD